jgi:hypothetical protein
MDILERWLVGVALVCLVIVVGLTGLLVLSPGDSTPTKVLRTLTAFDASSELAIDGK